MGRTVFRRTSLPLRRLAVRPGPGRCGRFRRPVIPMWAMTLRHNWRGRRPDDIVHKRIELLLLIGTAHGFYLQKMFKQATGHISLFRADFVRQRIYPCMIGRRNKELLQEFPPELADFTKQNVRLGKKLLLLSLNPLRLLRCEPQLSIDKMRDIAPPSPALVRRPHKGPHALLIPHRTQCAQVKNNENGYRPDRGPLSRKNVHVIPLAPSITVSASGQRIRAGECHQVFLTGLGFIPALLKKTYARNDVERDEKRQEDGRQGART